MNILFFLTPKNEVAYVENDDTLRQVLEKIEYHKYTAIPMLNKNGKYVGTVTEGDLLRYIKEKWFLNIREAEDCSISRVPLRWKYQTVDINCNMEDLVDTAMKQNLVPVLDDADNFIGIVRRSDILKYCYKSKQSRKTKTGRSIADERKTEVIRGIKTNNRFCLSLCGRGIWSVSA